MLLHMEDLNSEKPSLRNENHHENSAFQKRVIIQLTKTPLGSERIGNFEVSKAAIGQKSKLQLINESNQTDQLNNFFLEQKQDTNCRKQGLLREDSNVFADFVTRERTNNEVWKDNEVILFNFSKILLNSAYLIAC